MRDLFFKIFEMSHFNTGISVTAFSIPHFVYLALIFGALFLLYFKFKTEFHLHQLNLEQFHLD